MRSFGAVVAGLVTNFVVANIVSFLVGPIVGWLDPQGAPTGDAARLYLVIPDGRGEELAPGFLVSLVLIVVIPTVAGAFAGGMVAARFARVGQIPIAVLACLPVVVVLVTLGEYGPGGEAMADIAAVASPVAAVLGALMVRHKWRGPVA